VASILPRYQSNRCYPVRGCQPSLPSAVSYPMMSGITTEENPKLDAAKASHLICARSSTAAN
jgi:hypothetical protein